MKGWGNQTAISFSIFGLMGGTVDAMMRASTREAMRAATIVITPTLEGFGSLDWRRSRELAEHGYRAAEALRDQLLPLALGEAAWTEYMRRRSERRRTALPIPTFVAVEGAATADERTITERLQAQVGHPSTSTISSSRWPPSAGWIGTTRSRGSSPSGRRACSRARSRRHAPPFLMLGIGLENTTTGEFSFELAGRYLTFDAVGSGSELRVDAAAGSTPSAAVELLKPIGTSKLFGAVNAWFASGV
jgi:NTE family protein